MERKYSVSREIRNPFSIDRPPRSSGPPHPSGKPDTFPSRGRLLCTAANPPWEVRRADAFRNGGRQSLSRLRRQLPLHKEAFLLRGSKSPREVRRAAALRNGGRQSLSRLRRQLPLHKEAFLLRGSQIPAGGPEGHSPPNPRGSLKGPQPLHVQSCPAACISAHHACGALGTLGKSMICLR